MNCVRTPRVWRSSHHSLRRKNILGGHDQLVVRAQRYRIHYPRCESGGRWTIEILGTEGKERERERIVRHWLDIFIY